MSSKGKLITLAIHTYEKATILKTILEKEGIEAVIHNVNLIQPVISSGVRVRIKEEDLPLALKIIEDSSFLSSSADDKSSRHTKIRILIPVDFSEYSLKACNIGFDFAKKFNAEIILLYSYIGMNFTGGMPFNGDNYMVEVSNLEETKELVKVANSRMKEFSKNLKKDIEAGNLPDIKFKCVVNEGVPEEVILDYAKDIDPILIIMGTRGKSKKELELIGSVTAEVLDAGKFTVLTVPEDISVSSIDDIKNVVFFSNFCQQDLISFDVFVRMFKGIKLNVTFIPVDVRKNENEDKCINAVMDYCQTHYPEFSFNVKRFNEHTFLSDFDNFAKAGVDLIVIPNKKRNIFARLFNPSIAHKMLFHTDTPMLVIPV